MLIGMKKLRSIVTGISLVYAMGVSHVAMAEPDAKKQRYKTISVITILGQTDIAPNYQPAPIVFEDTNPYPVVPNHLQQSQDYHGELAANYSYRPLLDTLTIVTVSAGAQISSNLGLSQTLYAFGNTYAYQANHHSQTRPLLGAFVGQEYQSLSRFAVQFGLAYYQPSSAYSVKGLLAQGPSALTLTQLNYGYNVITREVLVEGKLLTNWRQRYYPYVSLGVGEAFNNVSGYQISTPSLLTKTPLYSAARNHSFAYRLGIGMDVELIPHVRMGLGYRFSDLGKINLGTALLNSLPINGILKQTHLYTNELLGQMSYIF
jgi:opacity protein-like surface antigen